MTKLIVVILFAFASVSVFAKSLSPADFNECIYTYWGARVKGGVIDAEAATSTAKVNLYPSIVGNVTDEDDFAAGQSTGFGAGGNVQLTQQLINISQWVNIHAKRISEKAAQLDFEDQLLTLMKSSTKAYFDYLQLNHKLKLLNKRVARIEKSVSLARELNRLRLSDSSSIYLAQADRAQLDISIANTESDSNSALNLLQASIGMGGNVLDFVDDYNPDVKNDLPYWANKVNELPGIQMLHAKAEAAGASATSARFQRLPNLSFNGYYGQLAATQGVSLGPSTGIAVFTLNIPIFDQGLTSIQTEQAESQKSVNEALVFSKREQLLAEVKNILGQWQSDEKIFQMTQEQLTKAQQGYNSVVTLFSFGKASFVAVKNSESSLIDAEIQLETVQKKIAEEKTILQLFDGYSSGKHHAPTNSSCSLYRARAPASIKAP